MARRSLDPLVVFEDPWVFTQSSPLDTVDFAREAKRRGFDLDPAILRELHRRGAVSPMVELMRRRMRDPVSLGNSPPQASGSRHRELRQALASGRVRDPASVSFRAEPRFDSRRLEEPRGWWNGFLYSRWQLYALHTAKPVLTRRRRLGSLERPRISLPEPDLLLQTRLAEDRRWAFVLAALEARYLPLIEQDWLQFVNTDFDEWSRYQVVFDDAALADRLDLSPPQVRKYAERLLRTAGTIDGSGDWSRLIRRAPQEMWKTLSGSSLLAQDLRIGAEVLLLFHRSLSVATDAEPLPTGRGAAAGPLRERLSHDRERPLDDLLQELGVSPHPRLVLAVEGETEEYLTRMVLEEWNLGNRPELIQLLCMRGADASMSLVAALAIAPLVGNRHGDSYDTIRPVARLYIAVDPDKNWRTDRLVEKQREAILGNVRKVVAAQGASIHEEDLQDLLRIKVWSAGCFEYAHFTDDELAAAIARVRPEIGGHSRASLARALGQSRKARADIDQVWTNWDAKPSKSRLAKALWPVLQRKMASARDSEVAPVPPIVEVVDEARDLALQLSRGRYVLRVADNSKGA